MNVVADIPFLAAAVTGVLLLAGATITFIGAFGLVRFRTFYERVHAPTLGTTVGMTCVALASMVYFSSVGSRVALHELLIVLFVTVTTPITLMILVRAAVFRDESEGNVRLPSGEQNGV